MRTLFLTLALLGLCAAAQAQARSANADRAAIAALEQRLLAHLTDPAVLEDILANDFAHPVAAGVVLTKRQHIDWARAHPTPPGVTVSFETLDVRLYGDAAVATGITTRRESGNAAPQRTIFTDVFAYRRGRWLAVSAQETPIVGRRRPE